jgi:HD-GYP domain-containing protein (c-di-GMP phosphodiesterase class II)
LKGDQIPLSARIFAIVDMWDALCSDRPYREAMSADQARKQIKLETGMHLDPAVARIFLKRLDRK